jgi:hypothetical protein
VGRDSDREPAVKLA